MSNSEIQKPKYWTQYTLQRIKNNKSLNLACTGSTGSGKSYAMLAWAEEIMSAQGKKFDVKNVVFTPKDFMQRINSSDLGRGDVLIFDEIGVAINSRDFMSVVNKALNFCFMTNRHRNWIILMTTPHLANIDASVRRLLHGHAVTLGVNQREKRSKLKFFSIQVNQDDAKIYKKYLRVKIGGVFRQVTRVNFGLPSPELLEAYEAKKLAFTKALNKHLADIIDQVEAKELGAIKKKAVVLTPPQRQVLDKMREGIDLTHIALDLGQTIGNVSQIKAALEKKGYVFKPNRNENGVFYDILEPEGSQVV